MLFATEKEYEEYTGQNIVWEEEKMCDYGIDALVNVIRETNFANKAKEVFIYANTPSGELYVAKRGVTFVKANAHKFDEAYGANKAFHMTQNGAYVWKTLPV